jgi:hypothetical protein
MTSAAPPSSAPDPLRVEHDALAARLDARRSIDEVRKGAWTIFLGAIAVGLTAKLAWDRWGVLAPGVVRRVHRGPPLFLWMAGAAAIVLLAVAIRCFLRARRLMREEDEAFARLRALRGRLGLDA